MEVLTQGSSSPTPPDAAPSAREGTLFAFFSSGSGSLSVSSMLEDSFSRGGSCTLRGRPRRFAGTDTVAESTVAVELPTCLVYVE